jgi:hypothetical protein
MLPGDATGDHTAQDERAFGRLNFWPFSGAKIAKFAKEKGQQ